MPLADRSPLPAVLVVTGIMAAGKSTIAQALAERLPRSVHLRGDVFRRMIVRGRAEPEPGRMAEAEQQLVLRYALAVDAASRYAGAGFTVIYQDVILGRHLRDVLDALRPWNPGAVVLCPSPEVAARRDAARAKTGYVSWTPQELDRGLRAETPRLGLWLDTSSLGVEETVEAILGDAGRTRAGIGA
jgi:predicted kinase